MAHYYVRVFSEDLIMMSVQLFLNYKNQERNTNKLVYKSARNFRSNINVFDI